VTDQRDTYLTLDFALRVGEVLLSSGAGAADVTATMLAITHACGLRNCEADVTFTRLALTYQPGPDRVASTQIRQVRHRETDHSQLTEVDLLVRALLSGEVDRDEARAALATLVSSGHPYSRTATSIGWGFMGMGAAILVGGDWIVTLIAFFGAVAVDTLLRAIARRRVPSFYAQVAGGILATVIAIAAAESRLPVDPSAVITASIILLLAGVAFVGAVQDALTGFYVTSSARALEAMLLTGGIIAGVSGGLALAGRFGVEIVFIPPAPGWSELPILLFGAALISAAFAYATWAPLRSLLPVAVVGMIAEVVFRTLLIEDVGRAWASAVASVAVGIVSYAVAGRFGVPPLLVVTAGIMPLLPGFSIYTGLFKLSEGDVYGLINLATAAAIAIALASGVILGEFIAQPLKREARRLEARLAGPRLVGPFKARSTRAAKVRD